MSTTSDIRSKRPTTTPASLALLLASCVRRRRGELGLSVKCAAELSGMETSDWYVLVL
jgi:hypothetical protein